MPVFLVVGDDQGELLANYHGTTIMAQALRGMWPALGHALAEQGFLLIRAVRLDDLAGFKSLLSQYNQGRYKVAALLHELILFARYGEVLTLPWDEVKPEADKGYVHMLQTLVPAGFRGLFLAALFEAIQSTVNSDLNSTATVFTLDIYKRTLVRHASEKHLVRMGMASSVVILLFAIDGTRASRSGGSCL